MNKLHYIIFSILFLSVSGDALGMRNKQRSKRQQANLAGKGTVFVVDDVSLVDGAKPIENDEQNLEKSSKKIKKSNKGRRNKKKRSSTPPPSESKAILESRKGWHSEPTSPNINSKNESPDEFYEQVGFPPVNLFPEQTPINPDEIVNQEKENDQEELGQENARTVEEVLNNFVGANQIGNDTIQTSLDTPKAKPEDALEQAEENSGSESPTTVKINEKNEDATDDDEEEDPFSENGEEVADPLKDESSSSSNDSSSDSDYSSSNEETEPSYVEHNEGDFNGGRAKPTSSHSDGELNKRRSAEIKKERAKRNPRYAEDLFESDQQEDQELEEDENKDHSDDEKEASGSEDTNSTKLNNAVKELVDRITSDEDSSSSSSSEEDDEDERRERSQNKVREKLIEQGRKNYLAAAQKLYRENDISKITVPDDEALIRWATTDSEENEDQDPKLSDSEEPKTLGGKESEEDTDEDSSSRDEDHELAPQDAPVDSEHAPRRPSRLRKIRSAVLAVTGIGVIGTLVYKWLKDSPIFCSKSKTDDLDEK